MPKNKDDIENKNVQGKVQSPKIVFLISNKPIK